MFSSVQEPYFLILANLQNNKRKKKETLRFSHRFFAFMHNLLLDQLVISYLIFFFILTTFLYDIV